MRFLPIFFLLKCLYLTDFSFVKSLSLTGNYLTITSPDGILVYDVENHTVKASLNLSNPQLGVLSPNLNDLFYLEKGKELVCYNLQANAVTMRKTLDFLPKGIGLGLSTVLLISDSSSRVLSYAGFELKPTDRENFYIFPVLRGTENVILPKIFGKTGKSFEISCVLYDSLNNRYFVGTRGNGVYVFSRNKMIYIDSLPIGIPLSNLADRIMDALISGDTLYIMTQERLVVLKDDMTYSAYQRPIGSSMLFDIAKGDSSLFILDMAGKIYKFDNGAFITIRKEEPKSPLKKLLTQNGNIYMVCENNILGFNEKGDTIFTFENPFSNTIESAELYKDFLAIIIGGRLFFISQQKLYEMKEIATLGEKILSIVTLGDTLWALTPSHLLAITPSFITSFEIPIKPPLNLSVFGTKPAILFNELALVKGDSTFYTIPFPQNTTEVLKVLKWKGKILFVSKRAITLCNDPLDF